MPVWLSKLLISFASNPKKTSNIILTILFVLVGSYLIVAILCMNMLGSFLNQKDNINEEFDIATIDVYKDIERVYQKFQQDMQKKIDDREQEIIKENTVVEYRPEILPFGNMVLVPYEVCNATVIKTFNGFSYAYLLAYINHSSSVKDLLEYQFNDEEIYGVMEEICTLKEEQSGTTYSLFTVIKDPEDIANKYYADETNRQMYLQSFELYEDFIDFVDNSSVGDNDEGNESGGGHKTSLTDEELKELESNLPADSEIAKKVIDFAASHLGIPYSQAKRNSGSYFDCSSYVFYAYQYAGIDICGMATAPTAAEEARYCVESGTVVSVDNLQPGDLVFYSWSGTNGRYLGIEHVAIYVGNGKVMDASSSRGYTVYRNLYDKGHIVLCGRPYK